MGSQRVTFTIGYYKNTSESIYSIEYQWNVKGSCRNGDVEYLMSWEDVPSILLS